MSHLLRGARSALAGRASRGVLAGAVVVAAASTAFARGDHLDTWWSALDASRWWEAGLLCVALIATLDGAGLVATGTARRWWTSGAGRDLVLGWGVLRAFGAASLVAAAWLLATAGVVLVRRGVPAAGLPGGGVELLVHLVTGFVVVTLLAHLLGAAVGRPWPAVALVLVATLPWSSEALDVLPQPPGWAVVLSPIAAGRAVAAGGTGSALAPLEVARGSLVAAAVATLGWAAALTVLAWRRPLVAPGPTRRHRSDRLTTAAALGAVALLGAVGPEAQAGRVPWMLQPSWRDARAHGRSATQVAGAWLRCRAEGGSCRRFEVAAGVAVGEGARQVLARQRHVVVAPDVEQPGPGVVDARIEVDPVRSGRVQVRYADVRVLLEADGSGWRVAELLGPVAVVGP